MLGLSGSLFWPRMSTPTSPTVRRFIWGGIAYTLAVILWGAYVRATGSGAGCGDHWPLCNGVVVPREPGIQTVIEFTHRLTSGVAFLFSLALMIVGFRVVPKGHPLRSAGVWQFVFMVLEALIGAGLVLFQLVADNPSLVRAGAMALHLVNTFLLMGALTLCGYYASGGERPRLRGQGALMATLAAAFGGMMVLGVSGAVTAMGDTLFPATSLSEAWSQDTATAHIAVRLRIFHPMIAIVVGLLVVAAAWTGHTSRPNGVPRRWAIGVTAIYGAQLAAGFINVVLLAPVWMQLLHLLLADLIWMALVWVGANALAAPATAPAPERAAEAALT